MTADIVALVVAHKYWFILLVALFEAPLVSIIIGFLWATGDLDLLLALGIVALGDCIGDTALFIFGRWCRPLWEKMGLRLNLSPRRTRGVLEYFGQRDRRAIVISKLVHGVGFTGLIAAGSLRIPYRRFILTCIAVSVAQSAVLAAVGVLSGRAYQSMIQWLGYLDLLVAAVFVLGLFVLYKLLATRIGDGDAES